MTEDMCDFCKGVGSSSTNVCVYCNGTGEWNQAAQAYVKIIFVSVLYWIEILSSM